jgi:hypothetical protein
MKIKEICGSSVRELMDNVNEACYEALGYNRVIWESFERIPTHKDGSRFPSQQFIYVVLVTRDESLCEHSKGKVIP